MKEILIFGHKRPDTDAVTSAIALSYLKNKMGLVSKPMILGPVNLETKFVLNYFNIPTPQYLMDVKLQLKDLDYYKKCYVNQNISIAKAYEYMKERNITGVPIVDDKNKLKGLLNFQIINEALTEESINELDAYYDNILDTLDGEKVLKFNEFISGNIVVPSCGKINYDLSQKDVVITSDIDVVDYAIEKDVKLIIASNIDDIYLENALRKKVNIIKTHRDMLYIIRHIVLCNSISTLLKYTQRISFNENYYYDDFKEKCLRLGYNNYPIVSSGNICMGMIRITDIGNLNRKRVILVDHNEATQSVDGLEEADVLEIIDHHKIGTITTNMPINFRNMTVGSTNTIIYSMFLENNVPIPRNIAGMMLSGIISDTLKFTSPTTTEFDKYVANKLKDIASIDIESYSQKMFKAGTNLNGKTLDEIINEDIKVFEVNNKKVAISQIFTLNSEEVLNKKEEYISKIDEIKTNREYDIFLVCLTDIIEDGTYLLFNKSSRDIVSESFNIPNIEQGTFIKYVVSRKKQIIPQISEFVR